MIAIIIFENETYRINSNLDNTINKLKLRGDIIIQKVYTEDMNICDHDISISIYKTQQIETNFQIIIKNELESTENKCQTEDRCISLLNKCDLSSATYSDINIGYSKEDVFRISKRIIEEEILEEAVCEVVYNIYNYQKCVLKGITAKDMCGNKIRPIVDIFVYQKPNMEMYNDSLDYVKNVNECLNEMNMCQRLDDNDGIVCDDMLHCHTNNEILLSILEVQKVHFRNSLNGIVYKVSMVNNDVYIQPLNKDPINENSTWIYIDDRIRKISIKNLIMNCGFNDPYVLIDAFNNETNENEIYNRFDVFIKQMRKKSNNIKWNNLLDLLNGLPIFNDHRAKYYSKLYEIYEQRFRKNKVNYYGEKTSGYLTISRPKEVDICPVGSLKALHFSDKRRQN